MKQLPFSIHIVKGHSMQPGIKDSSHLVVSRWAYLFSQPKPGDVVIFSHSDGKEYVKRVVAAANGRLVVEGDNKSDSKEMPPIPRKAVIGKVVASY